MREIITEDEVEKALHYLSSSVKDYAQWKSRMKYLEYHRKSVRAACILRATGKTMAENTQRGEAADDYKQALLDYKDAIYEFTLIDAYRHAAEAKIEAWRTVSASNRRGNI